RGFSTAAPENTLPALEAALAAGANVAEIDVKLTKDGKLILMHDPDVDRTTHRHRPPAAMTPAQNKKLDARKRFDPRVAATRVPTLDEVLQWSKGRLGILLEIKKAPERAPQFLDEVIATIERNNAADYVLPAGFDHPSLAEIHRRRPQWTLEMIMNCRLADTVHAAKAAGCTLVSLEPEYAVKEDTDEMHQAGLAGLTTLLPVEN